MLLDEPYVSQVCRLWSDHRSDLWRRGLARVRLVALMTRIHWPWWLGLVLFVAVLWFGHQTYQALLAVMQPTISSVEYVSEKVRK